MTLVIGTDEAGYGPNLGPLVVAASVWRVTDDRGVSHADVHADRIAEFAARIARRAAIAAGPWLDSKRLFAPAGGLAALERGVLALPCLGERAAPDTAGALAARLGIALAAGTEPPEWARFLATGLPVAAPAAGLADLRAAVADETADRGIDVVAVAARVVTPAAFNAHLDHGHNKSDILSRVTLDLAAALRAAAPAEEALVWCDRHGGRKAYASLVGRHFDAGLVGVLEEGPQRSRYRCGGGSGAATEIDFTVKGESRVPVALASMTAKYVRELLMNAFNDHWCARVPGLEPTAGYPVDARRWLAEAAGALAAAGVSPAEIWRRS